MGRRGAGPGSPSIIIKFELMARAGWTPSPCRQRADTSMNRNQWVWGGFGRLVFGPLGPARFSWSTSMTQGHQRPVPPWLSFDSVNGVVSACIQRPVTPRFSYRAADQAETLVFQRGIRSPALHEGGGCGRGLECSGIQAAALEPYFAVGCKGDRCCRWCMNAGEKPEVVFAIYPVYDPAPRLLTPAPAQTAWPLLKWF